MTKSEFIGPIVLLCCVKINPAKTATLMMIAANARTATLLFDLRP